MPLRSRASSERQRTEESHHEHRIDDRPVDRLERRDESPVVRPPQPRHDRIAIDTEHTRHQAHRHRGGDQDNLEQYVGHLSPFVPRVAWGWPERNPRRLP
jgi:hypothetical protein